MLRRGAPWAGGSTDGRQRPHPPPVAVGDVAPEPNLPAARAPATRYFTNPLFAEIVEQGAQAAALQACRWAHAPLF
eukprot:6449397-Alexandrium_andersonii.AAC.1